MNHHKTWSSVFLATAFIGSLFTSGCAARQAVYLSRGDAEHAQPNTDVEVLLDRAPDQPFTVTGELTAQSIANDRSIAMMRDRAKSAGLDGIYWIECTSPCSGRCTAKGFVYNHGGLGEKPMDGELVASDL